MKRLIVLTIACFFIFSATFALARETRINVDLFGGYSLMATADWDNRVDEFHKRKFERSVSDDSEYGMGPFMGLGLYFEPKTEFYHFRYGLEGCLLQLEGKTEGDYTTKDGVASEYEENLLLDVILINLIGGVEFGNWSFRPYIIAGIGTIISNMEIHNKDLADSGVAFTLAGGGRYYITDWVSAGLQLRFTDLLGLKYVFGLDDTKQLVVAHDHLFPLTALANVTFHF